MSERTIYLVRHGETDWNRAGRFQGHTDIALNEVGIAQARAVAGRLAGHAIGAVAASDLRRAGETASILAEELGLAPPTIDAELRERSYGVFEGLTREECEARHPEIWRAHPAVEPPGAEPRTLVAARMIRAVTRAAYLAEAVAVVSHGGAIRAFLEATSGTRVPPIPNVAIYVVEFRDDTFGPARSL